MTSPLRAAGLVEWAHLAPHVVVDRQGVDVADVAHGPQQVAHAPRRVADRVAAVRRGDPLVDDHLGHKAELKFRPPGLETSDLGVISAGL